MLRQLREELRSRGTAVVLQTPTIQGIGGVGKTQVALEYAHRFKEDYDVVWWLNCDPPQYVDASLVDLGKQLREVFGASVPEEGGVDAVASRFSSTWATGRPSAGCSSTTTPRTSRPSSDCCPPAAAMS